MPDWNTQIKRTYDADPDRCHATRPRYGQCYFKAVKGSEYCPIHGGNTVTIREAAVNKFKYRLARYQVRLDDITESANIKSLRDEIAILRLLMQKRLDACVEQGDLLMHSSVLSRLAMQIGALVVSCVKVEANLENIIDHQSAFDIAHSAIEAVAKLQTPPDEMLEIILDLLVNLNQEEPAAEISNYKVGNWQKELLEFVTSDKITSIRNEIGVMRLIIEELLISCKDVQDLVYKSNQIAAKISEIAVMVLSCHKLENSLGLVLDKEAAFIFGQELLAAISENIKDPEILEKIAEAL